MNRYYNEIGVNIHTENMGDDLCITICGGDKPHIGSVSIAEPRESLQKDGNLSATVSTYNFLGHKDNVISDQVAYELAKTLNKKTVIICGVHYEKPDEYVIERVLNWIPQIIKDISEEQI